MRRMLLKHGLTLVEMLIVITIIAILAGIVLSLATSVRDRANVRLMENNFAVLNAALEQFRDFRYEYKHSDYAGLSFPLDCDGFTIGDLQVELEAAAGLVSGEWSGRTGFSGPTCHHTGYRHGSHTIPNGSCYLA